MSTAVRGPGLQEESRLLAVPVETEEREKVVVVGTTIEPRNESLTDLAQLLLVGGPFALILASLAAYGVAAAALKPVEAMRSRAAEISAAEPDQRLPVPPTDDEVARLGKTLNEMLERLGEALEHERAFVADASHELRTPLAILRTELELALAAGRSPEELRAALASAAEETDRLTQLSEDLLTIAQTERGELPLRLERLDLVRLWTGSAAALPAGPRRGEREIEVSAPGLAGDLPPIGCDSTRRSAAWSTTPFATALARSSSRPLSRTVRSRFTCWTSGEGFPEEFLGRAFERFSRASASNRDDGSGLGLAIVQTVARAHGGEAYVANREEGGADVWLTLPVLLSSGLKEGVR